MDLDPSEWLQLEVLVSGGTEPLTTSLIEQLVKEGDTVIDIGAHVGHHSLIAARSTGPEGHVYAFDPQPYNCDRIARNASYNNFSQVSVICAAGGDFDGFINIPLQSESDRARLSLALDGPNDQNIYMETNVRRLDTFISDKKLKKIKLLKIDVEGFELEVLQGLGKEIQRVENIIFEMLDDSDKEKNRQIIEILENSGFVLKDVRGGKFRSGDELSERNVWGSRV
jgi:FkbM family methyltransferase